MDNRDSVFQMFDQQIQHLFIHPDHCNYHFDSLGNYIKITVSDDQKVRIFSWDDLTGGSYHTYTNFIQYQISNSCNVIPFDTSSTDIEAGYYDIKTVKYKRRTYYLLAGYGTYGSGMHHRVIRIFENKNGSLTECKDCFPKQEPLIVFSHRSQNIELQVHSERKEISYKQFEYDESDNYYTDKYEIVIWRFKKGKWYKEEKN